MTMLSSLVGGLLFHIFLVLISFAKLISLSVILLVATDHNFHIPWGRLYVLLPILVVAVDSYLWP